MFIKNLGRGACYFSRNSLHYAINNSDEHSLLSEAPVSTIRDLAKLAGVSVGTVSRVLNDADNVDAEIRRRTLEAAEKSGYRLAPRGRPVNKAKRRTERRTAAAVRSIIVATPGMGREWAEHELWQAYLGGITQACTERDYAPLVCMAETLDRIGELCRQPGAAGVLVKVGTATPEELRRLAARVPVVGFGSYRPELPIPQVAIDDHGAGAAATAALLRLGHRRIAFVNPSARDARFVARAHGYAATMRQAGLFDPGLTIEAHGRDSGHRPERELPDQRELLPRVLASAPTAVLLANDWHALGFYRACAAAGLHIPQDLSVAGMDDSAEARSAQPPLASVSLALGDVACAATHTLLDMVEGAARHLRGRASVHYVAAQMCLRDSVTTGPAIPPESPA